MRYVYVWFVWVGFVLGIVGGVKFGGGRVGVGREGGFFCDLVRRDRMLLLLIVIFVFFGFVSSMLKWYIIFYRYLKLFSCLFCKFLCIMYD